jgi:hypothetical protein
MQQVINKQILDNNTLDKVFLHSEYAKDQS